METLHASAVAFGGHGILIVGASGSGKSTLALELIGLGATLIADDRVIVTKKDGRIWLTAPEPLQGKIESRGIGILTVPITTAFARVVVDLDRVETERMPQPKTVSVCDVALPKLGKVESPVFAIMLRLYLNGDMPE